MGERTEYDKLIRDKIDQRIESRGAEAILEQVEGEELWERLHQKLDEESLELHEAKTDEELANEIGDVVEVLRAMCEHKGIDWDDVEAARVKKAEERGGFSEGKVLKGVVEK